MMRARRFTAPRCKARAMRRRFGDHKARWRCGAQAGRKGFNGLLRRPRIMTHGKESTDRHARFAERAPFRENRVPQSGGKESGSK